MKNSDTNKVYQFTLVLKNLDENTATLEDSLYEAGCDDALINFKNGTVYLDFDRTSTSFAEAVMSAISEVESSSVGATVVSVAPENLVTMSEIAKRAQVERQTVLFWTTGTRRKQANQSFPKPFMKLAERSPIWKWSEIAVWLFANKLLNSKEAVDNAKFLEVINVALERRELFESRADEKLFQKLNKDIERRTVNE